MHPVQRLQTIKQWSDRRCDSTTDADFTSEELSVVMTRSRMLSLLVVAPRRVGCRTCCVIPCRSRRDENLVVDLDAALARHVEITTYQYPIFDLKFK